MAIPHNAYALAYDAFQRELRPLLEGCIAENNPVLLQQFLRTHRPCLTDLTTERPLNVGWEENLDANDVDLLGATALTKYYDPTHNIGTLDDWHDLATAIDRVAGFPGVALGQRIGPPGHPLSPWGRDCFVQSPEEVRKHLLILRHWLTCEPDHEECLAGLEQTLAHALKQGKGLYTVL
jgi:hypothetical protein